MEMEGLRVALIRLSEALKDALESAIDAMYQVKSLIDEYALTPEKKHYHLIKQITLKAQVIIRKPKFAMARSNL